MARKTGTRDLRKSIAIIGDGYVEKYYFEDLRDEEQDEGSWFQILPRLPEKSGYFDKAINTAIKLVYEGVDFAFAIIDMDIVFSDGKVEEFKSKCDEVNEVNKHNSGNVSLCYCNPCFEYWLLLHFKFTTKNFRNCGELESELANELEGYNKSIRYHSHACLYSKLRPQLEDAISNSERSEEAYDNQETDDHVVSTVHSLFHKLRIGVGY